MTTKPLVQPLDVVLAPSNDAPTLNRLFAAAAISSRFCSVLLTDPKLALQAGFGGELFPLSERTYKVLTTIRARDLTEFVQKLNEKRLLA